ncbi:MAG: TIR domain-containing protein [Desulfobaccales bacterium]
MERSYTYQRTRFSAEVLREASRLLFEGIDFQDESAHLFLTVDVNEGQWTHDNEEEFFADYTRSEGSNYQKSYKGHKISVHCSMFNSDVIVTVGAPSRNKVQSVFNVFEGHLHNSRLPEEPHLTTPNPTIFIGHGQNQCWRDLKDHLQDKHDYIVEAYEIGARAGHSVRGILEDMLKRSSFAILIMTGEDETAEGCIRARQNVIHEAGLFQGKLGFNRAIILKEAGTEEFSNIQGIEQIRFNQGNIKETYGEVLATIRREFPTR